MSEYTQNKITNCHETKSQLSFIISSSDNTIGVSEILTWQEFSLLFTVLYYIFVRFYCENGVFNIFILTLICGCTYAITATEI